MIGILDPAFFLQRGGADADVQVRKDFEALYTTCRDHKIRLVTYREYWPKVWAELARQLTENCSSETRRAIFAIRRFEDAVISPELEDPANVWRRGFRQLFSAASLGTATDWEQPMAEAVARAVATNQPVWILARRVEGRNMITRKGGKLTIEENSRWLLHVQIPKLGARSVYCAYHKRNFQEKWTSRFDWRLPSKSDPGKYFFEPPDNWWKPATTAFGTVGSKPAWLDGKGNGWSRPNIREGAGYHWDVSLTNGLSERVGLDQINVTEFGAPLAEGAPGCIHHIPKNKRARFKGTGW